jgi:hypothetical protein
MPPKQDPKLFKMGEVGLIGRVSKAKQQEERLRADAWKAQREAELEAVLGRAYDGMDVPGIPEVIAEASRLMAPLIQKFSDLYAAAYPAAFAQARLGIVVTPGGIDPRLREQVRRDATRHLTARHRYMLANSAGSATEVLATSAMKATVNPEVQEILGKLAEPGPTTPTLEAPGPALGMLAYLLPRPEEWGLAGYDRTGQSPLLSGPEVERAKALAAPVEHRALPAPEVGGDE